MASIRFYLQRKPGQIKPRITCLVLVKSSHFRKVSASKATWLKKCDDHIIVQPQRRKVSSKYGAHENSTCQVPDGVVRVESESAWGAFCHALHLLPRPVQWLIAVPDSSLVIIENLYKFVQDRDRNIASYLGHPVKHYSGDYNVLSAGILMNNETLARVLLTFPTIESCLRSGFYWNNEDLFLGKYLQGLGVTPEDTRDEKGRGRFNGFNINTMLSPPKLFKQTDYYRKAVYPVKEGAGCCSPDLITLDGTDADHLKVQYFLMNNVGRNVSTGATTTVRPPDEVPPWVDALRSIGYTGPWENITAEQYYQIWANYMPPEKFNEKLRNFTDS